MKEYTTRTGLTQWRPSYRELEQMDEEELGFCLACGETQAAEPDACKYVCEGCGKSKVYGAAELALMGLGYEE